MKIRKYYSEKKAVAPLIIRCIVFSLNFFFSCLNEYFVYGRIILFYSCFLTLSRFTFVFTNNWLRFTSYNLELFWFFSFNFLGCTLSFDLLLNNLLDNRLLFCKLICNVNFLWKLLLGSCRTDFPLTSIKTESSIISLLTLLLFL